MAVKQSQVDKLYAGLKDLAGERRAKLDEALQLFMLNREVSDLEQWIADREVVASSQELGQDYDHVTVRQLIPFKHFYDIYYLFNFFLVIVGAFQGIRPRYRSHRQRTRADSQRHR